MAWRWHLRSLVSRPVCLAAAAILVAACSLSLDGDRFRDEGAGMTDDSPDQDKGGKHADAGGGQDRDPDAAPRDCRETCGGGDCDLRCPDDGCVCTLDCAGTSGTCKPRCAGSGRCSIDCAGVNNCEPECKGPSDCEIDCTGANNCDKVRCNDGATCTLHCSGADDCKFDRCNWGVTSCPGEILVCGGPCP
jgi:serine/threonine-protein kinase